MKIDVRPAVLHDLPLIAAFIRELAEYEKLSHEVRFDEMQLGENLFGSRPHADAVIGMLDDEPQGFALFFYTFSTFEGRPGIWLEDLFVRPEARGEGLGKTLLLNVARIAVQRGCARLEWSVLDWNELAIGFYRRLGARAMDDWRIMRVDGDTLGELGTQK